MEFKNIKEEVACQYGLYFEDNEDIVMLRVPLVKSFICNEVKNKFLEFLFICGITLLFYLIGILMKVEILWPETMIFFGIIITISLGKSAYNFFKLRRTVYILTNHRILIHCNFNNSNTKSIYRQFIQSQDLKKSFIDKQFMTGDIRIYTGETKDTDGKVEKVFDTLYSILMPDELMNCITTQVIDSVGRSMGRRH